MAQIRYRNLYLEPTGKSLYTQVKYDHLCPTKLKSNGNWIAIPDISGTSVGILPNNRNEQIKFNQHAPLNLGINF
jgi:hypothetical protein